MEKLKLTIVTEGSVTDLQNWSGTPFNIFTEMVRRGISVDSIDMYSFGNTFICFMLKVFNRLGIITDFGRAPLFHHYFAKKLQEELHRRGAELVLFISDHCLYKESDDNIKYFLYVDAVKRPVVLSRKYNLCKGYFVRKSLSYHEKRDRESYLKLNGVFSQNEWTRQYLINNYHLSSHLVTTINVGVNLEAYYGEKDYDNNLLLIVLRKGTEYYKGLLLLLDAFDLVKLKVPNIKLAVVGTEEVRKQVNVTYYYKMPRETTVELFRKCALYTMPALAEPNGITYLEGLANKAPIVGLNRFSVPEFSGYGRYGFIAPMATPQSVADTIVDALSDKKRLKEMGEEGQRYVLDTFKWNIVCDKMLNMMKKGG